MRGILLIILLSQLLTLCFAKENDEQLEIIQTNKPLKDILENNEEGTPLNAYIEYNLTNMRGERGQLRNLSSFKIKGYMPKADTPDVVLKDETKEKILNKVIVEVLVYKDSIACVVSEYEQSMYLMRYLSLEENRWLNAGEDLGFGLDDTRAKFQAKAPMFLSYIHQIDKLKHVNANKKELNKYLSKKGKEPVSFLLDSFKNNKITIYGELHRRKSSWDLWKQVVKEPAFAENIGIMFLEISSDKQEDLNTFFESKTLDSEIILKIFREIQINGWYDKGMYEFLIELWHLNKSLPEQDKIEVVAVDIARPFNKLTTSEMYHEYFDNVVDRNEQMAKIVSQTIESDEGTRNYAFIVGMAHAYKSTTPGIASANKNEEPKPTAGALLAKQYSKENVFTIFTHCAIISNDGTIHGNVRNGVFDEAFASNKDKSIAFNLMKSPFGREPFDAIYEISYDTRTGTYEDNYDGYIFLESLDSEPGEYLLPEIITDEFITELERRASLINVKAESWFGVDSMDKKAILDKIKSDSETKKWENKF